MTLSLFFFFMMSHVLFIFNPEHDLCLANGGRYYVPPKSALDFAKEGSGLMKEIYGDGIAVTYADGYAQWKEQNSAFVIEKVVPWGWDLRLKYTLLGQGMIPSLLPGDEELEKLRNLQHRKTLMPLQPHAAIVHSVDELLSATQDHDSVLKSPWSGAGRGVRFVRQPYTEQDLSWTAKVISKQGCVIVERRLSLKNDFALEFWCDKGEARFMGLSLFKTHNGVYRYNIHIDDDAIKNTVGLTQDFETMVADWIGTTIAPLYQGPLGVDCIQTEDGNLYVSEMNLRHTMGMIGLEEFKKIYENS